VGLGAIPAGPQGQPRLGAIQGLDLAFLVHAQHQRTLRRTQIKSDNRL